MADFEIGDVVVLSAGSMRMAVESVEDGLVHTVWCHEGTIGRDTFPAVLLRKWEVREDSGDRGGDRGGSRHFGKPPSRDSRPDRGGDGGHRPKKGRPGWDGKPREKKYFRKD